MLAVYTGKSVSALTAVASNDDISSTIWQSRVAFNPLAGTTYYIAVDGAGPIQGGLKDPVCGVSSRSAFAGPAGPGESRFYRVVEAP